MFKSPVGCRGSPLSKKQLHGSLATEEFTADQAYDDGYTLSARGDIPASRPYYVPGAPGALSPQPRSQRGTPKIQVRRQLLKPRPPIRRLYSAEAYKFRNLTAKMGSLSSAAAPETLIPDAHASVSPTFCHPPYDAVGISNDASVSSCNSTIETIPDEVRLSFPQAFNDMLMSHLSILQDIDLLTPQSRFAAFMKSRDLTHSPKKKSDVSERDQPLDELALGGASVVRREVAGPATRPLRGNARLPPRLPIPKQWKIMDMDLDSIYGSGSSLKLEFETVSPWIQLEDISSYEEREEVNL